MACTSWTRMEETIPVHFRPIVTWRYTMEDGPCVTLPMKMMICSTGTSWFLPTQGVVSWHAPIGAPMLARHFSALRSLIHMANRVAWHLVKMVMMSMIKGVSVSDYNKVSPFLVPWWTLRQIYITCNYFKSFLGVQLVKVCLLVLVISSYFFSPWHHCKRNEHLSQTKLFIVTGHNNWV